jgi:RimJ/RimL family protein N-acetyltransferase
MNGDLSILREVKLINGQVLLLRKPAVSDAEAMIEYLNTVGGESDNLLFGKNDFHLTVEQEIEHIERVSTDPNTLMVLGLIDNSIVSVAMLSSFGRRRIAHNSNLSVSVKKEHWAKGIGTAVMEELIRFAREHSVIKNISLGVKASNSNALKLYEKLGFVKVGLHKNYFNINGTYDDEILMDLYL